MVSALHSNILNMPSALQIKHVFYPFERVGSLSVFVFFACPSGGAFDSSRESMKQVDQDFELRLLDNDEFREYWTAETKKKYGTVKIFLFDVADWNPPELDLWSLEGDLPSIRTGALAAIRVKQAVDRMIIV